MLSIQNFVNFSTDNNIRLAQYDRQLHYTSVMMQRHRSSDIPRSLPVFVKDVPVKNEHMASQLVKQTPKMAFMKRRTSRSRDTHSNPIKRTISSVSCDLNSCVHDDLINVHDVQH
jgi:ssDNA-specific exonuclease RecJ